MSDDETTLRSAERDARIDALCDEFERAWQAGQTPRLEEYLARLDDRIRQAAFGELLKVEVELRRDRREVPTPDDYLPRFVEFKDDVLAILSQARPFAAPDNKRTLVAPSAGDLQPTIDHTPRRTGSRGLQIRCPHCSNPVEVVTDTPFDDISCSTCGSVFSLADREEGTRAAVPLKTIDRFDLITRLGVGGFGTVWKARDRDLDRVVAVKIPRRGQLAADEIEQFFREARSAAQLRHRHIVPVHEVGRDGETLFIVSDLVRGITLSNWLTGHRVSPKEVAQLSAIIADALHHAHEQGVIHRDLKPSNIMIDEEGQPHLMDFGLAKRETGEVTMTVDGQILGTPAYMSPEQAGGEARWTDRRTDIYSLGVIIFEMLTGELPFRGNHQMQLHQRRTEDAPDPRKLNRHIPRDLATICLKCLEREPGRRYATAALVRDEFQRYLRGEPIVARPVSRPERLLRWAKRKPMVATTAALVLFLAIAGPLAALAIERQRSRLAELLLEKNRLIDRHGVEKENDASRITQLNSQLDLWEGRANPWELWPPKRSEPPRQQVAEKLLQHARGVLETSLPMTADSGMDRARISISLAILADAASRRAEATEHYRQAIEHLVALRAQMPQEPHIAQALADCHHNLARLVVEEDRAAAVEHLEVALAIRRELAEGDDDAFSHIAWLETELQSAALDGFVPAQQHLEQAAQIERTLASSWPKDPAHIYRLACYLTQRQAVLDAATEADR